MCCPEDLVRTPQFESCEAAQTAQSAARRVKFLAKPKTESISPEPTQKFDYILCPHCEGIFVLAAS